MFGQGLRFPTRVHEYVPLAFAVEHFLRKVSQYTDLLLDIRDTPVVSVGRGGL